MIGVCLIAWILAACGTRTDPGPGAALTGPIPADSTRFSHPLHTGNDPRIRGFNGGKGLGCTDCHLASLVTAGQLAQPGKNQHAPCDVCHKDEFYKPPGAFCQNCHVSVDPLRKGQSPLQPYPERGLVHVLAARFSHEQHLDQDDMESATGHHVDCTGCHTRDPETRDPQIPGHAACVPCHEQAPKAKAKLAMSDCAACHPTRNVDIKRGRKLITHDLVFAHKTHEVDKAGNAIACRTCHEFVEGSRDPSDQQPPTMQSCATCHEDPDKTPDRVRIENCSVCHSQLRAGVAPRSHMAGGMAGGKDKGLPDDHTIAFRTDHADAAAAPDARCGFCHTGLSRSSKDSCNECHATWAPRDHTMGFKDDAHGREAVVDRDRCAVCHTSEFCTACHSQPPRSHRPLGEFRLGGHAEAARFDLRSCFACHTEESTCSDCHRGRR